MVAFQKIFGLQHHAFNVLREMTSNEVLLVLLTFLFRNVTKLFSYSSPTLLSHFQDFGSIPITFRFTTSFFQHFTRNDFKWSIACLTHFIISQSNETLFPLFSNYIKSLPRVWLQFENISFHKIVLSTFYEKWLQMK